MVLLPQQNVSEGDTCAVVWGSSYKCLFCVCLQTVMVLLPQQSVSEGDTCAVEGVQNSHSLYLYPLRGGTVHCCLLFVLSVC